MNPWTRRSLVGGCLLVAAVCVAWLVLFFLHRSGFVKGLMNQYLAGISLYSVSVGDAWLDLWGPAVEVRDLQVFDQRSSSPLAKVPSVRVDLGLNPFQDRFLAPSRCTVPSGSLEIPMDLFRELRMEGRKTALPAHLPEVWIRDLALQLNLEPGRTLPLGSLSLAFSPLAEGDGAFLGRLRLPVGPHVPISGSLDPKGRLSVVAGGELRFDGAGSFEAQTTSSVWRQLDLSGSLFLRFQGRYDQEASTRFQFSLDGNANRLAATIPDTPFRLRELLGSFSFRSDSGGYANLRALWEETSLLLTGTASWTGGLPDLRSPKDLACDAFLAATNLPFDERIRRFAAADRTLREVWDAFSPEGRCDVMLRARKAADEPRVVLEPLLRLQGVRIVFRGFPEEDPSRIVSFPAPVSDLRGEILCQPECVSLRDLQGKLRGADFSLKGALFGAGRIGIDLEMGIQGLPLDAETRKAVGGLPKQVGEAWDLVELGGSADIGLRLTKEPGPTRLRATASIRPRKARASYRGFPLPLSDLEGEISIDPESLWLRVGGRAGPGELEVELSLQGLRRIGPEGKPGLGLRILGRGVPVEDRFRQALEVLIPGLVADIDPKGGTLEGEIRLWRDPAIGDEPRKANRFLARLAANRLSVRQAWFPLSVEEVTGPVFFASEDPSATQLVLESLEGRALGAPVLFRYAGALRQKPGESSSHIEIRAFGVPLVADLFRALVKARIPGADQWAIPEWQGGVDFTWSQRRNRDLVEESRSQVLFQDVGLRLPGGRVEIGGLTGKLEFRDNTVQSERLSARIGETALDVTEFRSSAEPEGPKLDLILHVPYLSLGPRLERVLPEPLVARLRGFGFQGTLSLEGLKVAVQFLQDGSSRIRFEGPLRLQQLSTQGGIPIQEATGSVSVEKGEIARETISVQGRISEASFEILGRRVDRLDGRFEVGEHRFRLFEVSGSAYGGTIGQGEGTDLLRISLEPPHPFDVDIRLTSLNLRSLLRDLLPRARDLQGSLSANLLLEGKHADLKSLRGQGEIQIRDGSLWEVPVFREISRVLSLRKGPLFSAGKVSFRIEDRRFVLTPPTPDAAALDLSSPVMALNSRQGALGFDGSLDLQLNIRSFSGLPLVDVLIGGIANLLMDIQLTGTIGSPRIFYSGASGEPVKKEIYVPGLKEEDRPLKL